MNMMNVPKSLEEMDWQRMQWITFHKSIAAGVNSSDVVQISDDGAFQSYYMGVQYTTLVAGPADGGACQISIKLTDNGRRWDIIDNLAPVSLFASPGRQRSSGIAGDPSNPLFVPVEFPYIFLAGTTIRVEFTNGADFANELWIIWYGNKIFKDFNAQNPAQ